MKNSRPKEPTNDELKWLLIDFDDTIARNTGHPEYLPTVPVEGAIEALQKLHREGWKITIYTARPWSGYKIVEDWCDKHEIPHRRIICGKPLGRWIIDDRNIEFNGSWKDVLNKVGDK